jgi:hypothetical protein
LGRAELFGKEHPEGQKIRDEDSPDNDTDRRILGHLTGVTAEALQ